MIQPEQSASTTLETARTPQQVFIVGAPRSGTSIMMKAVQRVLPDHSSFPEGHFIDIIPHLTAAVRYFFNDNKKVYLNYKDFAVSSARPTDVEQAVVDAVITYYSSIVGDRFIDKTHGPAMIYALRHLKRTFPNSKAILLRRRALEYMRSVMQKFTQDNWDENLTRWLACAKAWREISGEMKGYCLPVEHYELAHDPENSSRMIADHLGLGAEDRRKILAVLNGPKVEKTQGTDYSAMDISDLELDEDTKWKFMEQTKSAFEWNGYSYDRSYYRRQQVN